MGDRALELELALARKGVFLDEKEVTAAFDPEFETTRAKGVAKSKTGVNIDFFRDQIKDVDPATASMQKQVFDAVDVSNAEFERRKKIAASGVELNTPFPASSAGVGFSDNPAEAVQEILTTEFAKQGLLEGQKATVRTGPVSGELEFQDPRDGKFHLVNLGSAAKAGFAIPATTDVIGSVAGGIIGGGATKSVSGALTGEVTGSTVGTAFGTVLQLGIGRAMGFNNLSTSEILSAAGEQGGKAGAITLATGGAIVSAKALKNFLDGNTFSRRGALEAGFTTDEADEITRQINELLESSGSESRVRPTVAQQAQSIGGTDEVAIGSVEATMRTKADFAQEFVERDASNQTALTEAFEVNQNQFFQGPNLPADAARDALASGVARRTGQARGIVATNQKELGDALDSLDARFPEATGKDVRPVIEAKREIAADAVDEANDNWRSLVDGYNKDTGLTGIEIPVSDGVRKLKIGARSERQGAIASVTKTKSPVLSGKKKSYDLRDYNVALRDLKASVRNASKNGNITNVDIGRTKQAITQLEAARNKGLIDAGRGDVLEALLDAESKRAAFGETFERSMVANFIARDGAGWAVKNEKLFAEIINAGGEDLDILLRVIGDDPQAMNAAREGIVGLYHKQVIRNGTPDLGRHKLFLETNSDLIGKFFNSAEQRTIQGLGRMGEVVRKQGAQLDKIIKNGEKTWGRGKLTSLDPEKMVDFVFNNSSVIKLPSGDAMQVALKKTRWLKASLKSHPAALRGLQADYAQRIGNEVVKDGVLQPKAIDKILKDEEVLREFMGHAYVNNLKTIRGGMALVNKKFNRLSGDEFADAVKQAFRGTDFAAPLSKRGRRFTAALLFARRANHKVMKDALLNPNKLGQIAELVTHNAITRRTVEIASSLGIILPIQGEIEDQ